MTNKKITEDGELPVSQPKDESQPTSVSPTTDAITASKIFEDAAKDMLESFKAAYGSPKGTLMEQVTKDAAVSESRLVRLRIYAPDDVELHGKYITKKVLGFHDQSELYTYVYSFVDKSKASKFYTETDTNHRALNHIEGELSRSISAAGLTNVTIEREAVEELTTKFTDTGRTTTTPSGWSVYNPHK